MYYAEELIFSSCHYRLRYAYTYSIQFDIDEFWSAGEHIPEKTLPAFLDKYMHPDAASMGFSQVSPGWALQHPCSAGAVPIVDFTDNLPSRRRTQQQTP